MTKKLIISVIFYDFFFFNDTATTEIYTLSLHDALPICIAACGVGHDDGDRLVGVGLGLRRTDRKSTRLNSSHLVISYAVFCLKKKNSFITSMPHKLTLSDISYYSKNYPLKSCITPSCLL